MKYIFFTPGPSQLYPTVGRHIKIALDEQILSISHRGKQYQEIHQKAVDGLRSLFGIPSTHHIFFLSSGTEAMERVIQNVVEEKSFHFVNGSFAKRFYEIAVELGKKPEKYEVPVGEGFLFDSKSKTIRCSCHAELSSASTQLPKQGSPDVIGVRGDKSHQVSAEIPNETELLCLTHNETSTGVALQTQDIYSLKKQFPEKLIALDVVSSIPYIDIDYTKIDLVFFSVQKGFGLPAGLGVIVVSPQAYEKAEALQKRGISIGSYHSFVSLEKSGVKFETPETPNVLDIYLLGKVIEDMQKVGIEMIRKEIEEKAKMLYDFFDKHDAYKPFVKNKKFRSQTVIVVEVGDSKSIIERLKKQGLVIGSGYGSFKETQLRIANFPAITKTDVKKLLLQIKNLDQIGKLD